MSHFFSATKYIHDEISMEAEYCVVDLNAVLYICSSVIITSDKLLVLLGASCVSFLGVVYNVIDAKISK